MSQNPALVEALAKDRAAELRRQAARRVPARAKRSAPRVAGAARRGAGWLLVDLGLWLAVPRRRVGHTVARVQR